MPGWGWVLLIIGGAAIAESLMTFLWPTPKPERKPIVPLYGEMIDPHTIAKLRGGR